ncbi:hypothetical protein UFOVP257_109 [uncultured Caudovirales phage]|uniref:Uncharacterized protein n=1 Tax=uncultured Caudovirales phage TaxID=2100421 RepID=A0A6J5LI81_9CAUD|nr:hypothetical protein UFOVP257_109 [uncultured Caudovirales phage]
MNKLDINNEMRQFDQKNREFYDDLTDEERKKFSNFLMIRWGSSVEGARELQEYYLLSCNENLNKNFFDISKHPKLQWLCATAVSPDMGSFRHDWIKVKKRDGSNSKSAKFLREMYPNYSDDEIELLIAINDTASLKQLAKEHGYDDKRIKSEL